MKKLLLLSISALLLSVPVFAEKEAIELYDLHAETGDYVPVCMPYILKKTYFGDLYVIGCINGDTATLVPSEIVAAGTPCVIKVTQSKLDSTKIKSIKISSEPTDYNLSLWDNVMLLGDYESFGWTASPIEGEDIQDNELKFVETDIKNMNFSVHLENNAVERFWKHNPVYTSSVKTNVARFVNLPVNSSRTDKPNPVIIPIAKSSVKQTLEYSLNPDFSDKVVKEIPAGSSSSPVTQYKLTDDLLPGFTYYYRTTNGKAAGQFTLTGSLRMMYIGGSVVNMRDLGGKKTADGRYVKYGKLYRSAEMKGNNFNIGTAELNVLTQLNILAEIDLKQDDGNKPFLANAVRGENYYWAQKKSGDATYVGNGPKPLYNESSDVVRNLKEEFAFMMKHLRNGVAVDFHCRIGADRTGLMAFLLQGLLGVSETDILLDYETTSFSEAGVRTKDDGDGAGGGYVEYLPKIKTKYAPDGTFQDIFENYFQNVLDVDSATIEEFRDIMLGASPIEEYLPTSVNPVVIEDQTKISMPGIYDILGRKVSDSSQTAGLKPGLYIINGKKVSIK